MNVLETEWWTLALPPEWWGQAEDDSILIGDQDEVGCIEISTLHKEEGAFAQEMVRSIAQQESEQQLDWCSVVLGEFAGVTASYVQEGSAVREWYVVNASLMLFITYSCAEDNRGMDDAAVDEILETLMVGEPA